MARQRSFFCAFVNSTADKRSVVGRGAMTETAPATRLRSAPSSPYDRSAQRLAFGISCPSQSPNLPTLPQVAEDDRSQGWR